jgi:phenylalanyl-tRNA synthetase beta chain
MDIKILDSWLKDYLITSAKPEAIARYLSLCGPSAERVEKFGSDFVYDIEVTTNRIDSASVYGIAREGAAILPRFGVSAKLKKINPFSNEFKFVKKVNYLNPVVDPNLCKRFSAVLIKNVKIGDSPEVIKTRLESAGIRAINNIVDISNYIMLELGQPVHTFDYDKIKGAKMILRESKKDEKITTLDKKIFTLKGGDIVIEDGSGRLIDLAGVMGGDLSAVDENTKNVLLFVQTYDPVRIRKTSMGLAQRTIAATIFEKGTDPELVTPAIMKGIEMFKSLCKGEAEKEIIDLYPIPFKPKKISLDLSFIEKRLGITISKKEISSYLTSLEFETDWHGNNLEVQVPSFRSQDVVIPEDIVEEIARIYGYHNLPSEIMTGKLTGRLTSPKFAFEERVKNYLSGWGGCEVYTLSLVPKDFVDQEALKLKNPLGVDSEYLRTSLMPSLILAAKENTGTFETFHLFEMSNIYIPRKNDLPEEKLILAGILEGYKYREAKGIVEALLEKLHLNVDFEILESKGFAAGKCVEVLVGSESIGKIGYPENSEYAYYEFEVEKLFKLSLRNSEYIPISKYPSQIEDLTLNFPDKTMMGEVINSIKSVSKLINKIELGDIYKNSHTFRIEYQNPEKTLTDNEVEEVRTKILTKVKERFGGQIKN